MKFVSPIHGRPDQTISLTSSDLVQTINPIYTSLNGKPAIAALITCETADVRFTCGPTDPVQAPPLGHILYEGQSLKLSNGAAVKNFKFINAVNGSNAALMVTFEYIIGA